MRNTCGVFLIDNRNRLLVCHITNCPMEGRTWSIPKGIQDKGETTIDAALRELVEETGLQIKKTNLIPLKQSKYYSASMFADKTLVSYLVKLVNSGNNFKCVCHSQFKNKDGKFQPEVDAFLWVDLEMAEHMIHKSQVVLLNDIKEILNLNKKLCHL